jgi:hypothetical protein
MLYRPSLDRIPFDKDDNIIQRAENLLNFWENCSKSDVWNNIYDAIDGFDYSILIHLKGYFRLLV